MAALYTVEFVSLCWLLEAEEAGNVGVGRCRRSVRSAERTRAGGAPAAAACVKR